MTTLSVLFTWWQSPTRLMHIGLTAMLTETHFCFIQDFIEKQNRWMSYKFYSGMVLSSRTELSFSITHTYNMWLQLNLPLFNRNPCFDTERGLKSESTRTQRDITPDFCHQVPASHFWFKTHSHNFQADLKQKIQVRLHNRWGQKDIDLKLMTASSFINNRVYDSNVYVVVPL